MNVWMLWPRGFLSWAPCWVVGHDTATSPLFTEPDRTGAEVLVSCRRCGRIFDAFGGPCL